MPPASPTKSSIAKKVQVSTLQNRPKGAGRAKSGCYTCRLRRKKCDELRVGDETGPCATCARLKLECLGFGAKRPDWMRDTAVIAEIRERIKEYLGSQGMIKGHSGAGPRVQVQEDYLRLSDIRDGPSAMGDYPSGSSSSDSPGREDSVESENNFPLPQYQQYQQPLMRLEELYTGQSDLVSTRCDSPMDPSLQFEYPSQYPFPMVTPSGYDLSEMFDFYPNM